jgi:hypothetical protein
MGLKVTIFDLQILPLDIAVFVQSLQPSLPHLGNRGIPEISDPMNRLLSPGLRRK